MEARVIPKVFITWRHCCTQVKVGFEIYLCHVSPDDFLGISRRFQQRVWTVDWEGFCDILDEQTISCY